MLREQDETKKLEWQNVERAKGDRILGWQNVAKVPMALGQNDRGDKEIEMKKS